VLWDPPDSDFLYWLRAGPPAAASGVFLHTPRGIGEAEALLGGDAARALLLSKSGASRALSTWDAATGGRSDGSGIESLERFGGIGVASERRALFATQQRLYLCDLERGGWLLDEEPLPDAGIHGASVFAEGEHVVVVGERSVWIFRVLR
jgi:hypothetical protein